MLMLGKPSDPMMLADLGNVALPGTRALVISPLLRSGLYVNVGDFSDVLNDGAGCLLG